MSVQTLINAEEQNRRVSDGLIEKIKIYAIIAGLVTMVFTGGYNWRGVRDLETKVQSLDTNTVKKDVLAEQLRTLTTSMDGLRRELELLRDDTERRTR